MKEIKIADAEMEEMRNILNSTKSIISMFNLAMIKYAKEKAGLEKERQDWWYKIGKKYGLEFETENWEVCQAKGCIRHGICNRQ